MFGLRSGFVDVPDDELKTHSGRPVPLGGVAVYVALHSGLAVMGEFDIGLLAGSTVVLILGLADDRLSLSPIIRLVVVSGAALATALLRPDPSLAGAIGFTVAVLIVVNAINLFDGLDGLVAISATLTSLGLAAVFWSWPPLVLGAALLGFYLWNRPPARLYLGDNGAYLIGLSLVWLAYAGAESGWEILVGLALVGVPLIDMAATIFRRYRSSDPLFEGDRDHSYDRLHQSGRSVAQVGLWVGLIQAAWVVAVLGIAAVFAPAVAATGSAVLGVGLAVLVGLRGAGSEAAAS